MSEFDPFDPSTWGQLSSASWDGPNASNSSSISSQEHMTSYELTVGEYVFDMELHAIDNHLARFLLAPRRIPGERDGCVVLEWDPDPTTSDGSVHIASIVHNSHCSSSSKSLEKKYGTRAMVLGSLNAMKAIAADRWPFLSTFFLQDEATFNCPPLEKSVRTFAVDLLIGDMTYYERHLDVHPDRDLVRFAKERMLRRVHGKIPTKLEFSKVFEDFLSGSARDEEKIAFLNENYVNISTSYGYAPTWRSFFIEMHRTYGCSFFAACGASLIDMFEMRPLLGAGWVVEFSKLLSINSGLEESRHVGSGIGKLRPVKWSKLKRERMTSLMRIASLARSSF